MAPPRTVLSCFVLVLSACGGRVGDLAEHSSGGTGHGGSSNPAGGFGGSVAGGGGAGTGNVGGTMSGGQGGAAGAAGGVASLSERWRIVEPTLDRLKWDGVLGVAARGPDEVLAVGNSGPSPGEAWLKRYGRDFAPAWTAPVHRLAAGVAVNSDDIFALSDGAHLDRSYLHRYQPNGDVTLRLNVLDVGAGADVATRGMAIAADERGAVCAGRRQVPVATPGSPVHYDAVLDAYRGTGAPTWSTVLSADHWAQITDVAVRGDTIAATVEHLGLLRTPRGPVRGSGAPDLTVINYQRDGTVRWVTASYTEQVDRDSVVAIGLGGDVHALWLADQRLHWVVIDSDQKVIDRREFGPGKVSQLAVTIDARGALILAGVFSDELDLGDRRLIAASAPRFVLGQAFVAKYKPNRELLAARTLDWGGASGCDRPISLASDSALNVVVGISGCLEGESAIISLSP